MNTLTADTATTHTSTTGWWAAALRTMTPPAWRSSPAPSALQVSAAALLERADAYASTQPSFAADLRAAAWRVQDTE